MFRQSAVSLCMVLPALASSIAVPRVAPQSSGHANHLHFVSCFRTNNSDLLIPQAGPLAHSGSDTVHESHFD